MIKYILSIIFISVLPFYTVASELIYTPTNPSFGGNPLNSSHLLGVANAINDYRDPNAIEFEIEEQSEVERLAASLESRLISQLLSDIGNGNTGQLETDAFYLNIVDNNGSLAVQIVDKNSGETSIIQVSGLDPNN